MRLTWVTLLFQLRYVILVYHIMSNSRRRDTISPITCARSRDLWNDFLSCVQGRSWLITLDFRNSSSSQLPHYNDHLVSYLMNFLDNWNVCDAVVVFWKKWVMILCLMCGQKKLASSAHLQTSFITYLLFEINLPDKQARINLIRLDFTRNIDSWCLNILPFKKSFAHEITASFNAVRLRHIYWVVR